MRGNRSVLLGALVAAVLLHVALARTHLVSSRSARVRLAAEEPSCDALKQQSKQEAAQYLTSIGKPGFAKKFTEWTACLVPVDKQNQAFSWQWKLAPGANCDQWAAALAHFADRFAGSPKYKFNTPFDIARDELEKAAGGRDRLVGNDLIFTTGVWDLCNGKKPTSEMGVSDKSEPGTRVSINIKCGKGIPYDEAWPIKDNLISAHAFCFQGVVDDMGAPYVGDTDQPDRHQKRTTVSLRKYKKYDGYACQLLDTGARTYSGTTCLASVWFKKLSLAEPWHLVVDNSVVSNCPYEFVLGADNSESSPSIEIRMKAGRQGSSSSSSSSSTSSSPSTSRRNSRD